MFNMSRSYCSNGIKFLSFMISSSCQPTSTMLTVSVTRPPIMAATPCWKIVFQVKASRTNSALEDQRRYTVAFPAFARAATKSIVIPSKPASARISIAACCGSSDNVDIANSGPQAVLEEDHLCICTVCPSLGHSTSPLKIFRAASTHPLTRA